MAPRSFVMPKPIDVSPIARLSRRRSSRPSSTTATSLRRTGAPFRVGDDEVAERRDVDRLALGADVHLALGALDAPGRHLLVLARDRAVDVDHGEAVRLESRGVVPDPDVAVAEAEDVDLADALDHLQLRAG